MAGCGGDASSVDQPSGGYDAIIVGGGTAGVIVAAKLRLASGGKKRILIIEAGGPASSAIGGTAFPYLIPTIVPAHPVGTIMAVADRAGDILAPRL